MHKFGYTEEMLQRRLFERMKEKQESHEKLAHTETERIENDIYEITKKMDNIKLIDEVNRSQSEQLQNITAKIT